MKKLFIIPMIVMFLLISVSSIISGMTDSDPTSITIDYCFDVPMVESVTIDEMTYQKIIMGDVSCAGNPGEPLLPVKGAYVLLPPDQTYHTITIEPKKEVLLEGSYQIVPVSHPVPISASEEQSLPTPDPEIYHSSSIFPGKLYDVVGTYMCKGYTILVLNLYPVQYSPLKEEVFYYPQLSVSVECISQSQDVLPIRKNGIDRQDVEMKVDNPSLLALYDNEKGIETLQGDHYDLLIITTEAFKDSFIPLKEAHDARGILTEIKTLSDISILPETVSPEDIRDFIREQYLNNGIRYVLLGGDKDVVPAQMFYVAGMDEDKWFMETEMPSDTFYACLDGPFNADGDDKWAEPTDGENGGDVDLFAEVYVGRACVDSVTDVNNFVGKTISYMTTDLNDGYLNKVIMAGEYLGDHGIASWGGNYLDLLINGSSIDGYTTTGMPADRYDITKLYDRDWPDGHDWPAEELIDLINNDVHIINHDGHSNYQYNMKMGVYDVDSFTNDKYFFVYSVGCMAGGFDDPHGGDCFAEYLTVKTDNGAFAAIMNARYGFFWSQSTDGDGTRYTREFWDAVFRENIPVIGHANQDSKEDNVYLINRSCMRWTYYELHLFGDPSVAFHISRPPEKPSTPTGPNTGQPSIEYTFTTSTVDQDGDTVYYLFDWDDGTTSGWIGPVSSGVEVDASHIWAEKGSYEIKVKARDESGIESPWSDPFPVSMPKQRSLSVLFHVRDLLQSLRLLWA